MRIGRPTYLRDTALSVGFGLPGVVQVNHGRPTPPDIPLETSLAYSLPWMRFGDGSAAGRLSPGPTGVRVGRRHVDGALSRRIALQSAGW